ncbi:hypothetical protein BANRA_00014 [Klebsiella pneumoniae]|nr:hypothetical protein BANRA_00014 [Klebsiella pneumoniae]
MPTAARRAPVATSISTKAKKFISLIVSADNKTLLGAVLGDTSDYGNLLQLVLNAIELPENPDSLILPAHAGSGKPSIGVDKLPDSAQICSCFDVSKGDLIAAITKATPWRR